MSAKAKRTPTELSLILSSVKHIEPDPTEQAALAQILTLRGQGRSLRQIAVSLNRQALRTRRGAGWRHHHVLRVIGSGLASA